MFNKTSLLSIIAGAALLSACSSGSGEQQTNQTAPAATQPKLSFQSRMIADSAKFWWAKCPAKITDDEVMDLVFIDNNSAGGILGYYEGRQDSSLWTRHIIAEKPPTGGLFASGDLECADMDGDGDVDVMAVKHPGEWTDADATAELFWYENPGWQVHKIGTVPDAVKDMSLTDFDGDGKTDLAILTFEEHTLSVFRQQSADQWERVLYLKNHNDLHEGMDVGDVDGDQLPDIVADAFIFHNPGGDLKGKWKEENLDKKWNSQKGDWSRNGTKAFLRDLDGDGKSEIFISHSERSGYPLVYYKQQSDGKWQEHIISDSIAACHTVQVFDFDQDGNFDVLAGVNKGRAVNLGKTVFEVTIFLGDSTYQSWKPMVLEKDGIYNGQVADYDGDGDYDIFRYPNHEATKFYLLENQLKP